MMGWLAFWGTVDYLNDAPARQADRDARAADRADMWARHAQWVANREPWQRGRRADVAKLLCLLAALTIGAVVICLIAGV